MIEGWSRDDYLILFEEDASGLEQAYALAQSLPGHRLLGLRNWDDFIIQDEAGAVFCVPTVPLRAEQAEPFVLPEAAAHSLRPDPRFTGRIKWYLKPIVFGGDPAVGANLVWVSLAQHAELVRYWNDIHRKLTAATPK